MLLCDTVRRLYTQGFRSAKMKENVLRGLDLGGFPPADIRYEDFHHPPHLDAPELPECEVSAEYEGKTIHFTYHPNEESLMGAISRRGLDAPQACRGGVCGSCRASINEGEVSVEQDFALTREEKTRDGYSAVQRDLPPTSSASPSRKANELVGLQREAPLRSFLDALKDPLHHFITAVPFRLKKLRCAWNELLSACSSAHCKSWLFTTTTLSSSAALYHSSKQGLNFLGLR